MSYISCSYNNFKYTNDTIYINDFNLSVFGKVLLDNSKLSLSKGCIYGLVGKNGSGKTSLLKKIVELKQESDNIIKIDTLYVSQEIELDDRNPVEYILDSDFKKRNCENELNKINEYLDNEIGDEYIINKQQELTNILSLWNIDIEKNNVIKILYGLGFSESDLIKPSILFSGGWQMRISLARALYLKPNLLLLDEPTNHLDLEAIIWLSNYLLEWENTLIVISHNIGFLNEITDYILNIENNKLVQYKGNYSTFKTLYNLKYSTNEKEWDNYNKKLKDMRKKNTDKNKINEFIEKNNISKPEKPYIVNISFLNQPKFNSNIITLDNVNFSYDNNTILKNIDINLNMESKIILVGPNGSGKSTIVKLMMNEIEPNDGMIYINKQARIGYYSQQFEKNLPFDKTATEYLESIIPKELIKNNITESVRSYLGQLKIEPIYHNKKISELSGGQKAKVSIIKLIFSKPHLLILDEPTNHLDIESVEGLINGLCNFDGGILLITHETELIEKLNGEIYFINPQTQTINKNMVYDEYCDFILNN